MYKKLRITVEGKTYDVTVEELTESGHPAPSYPSIAGTGVPTSVANAAPLAAPQPNASLAAPQPNAPLAAPQPAAAPGDEISPLSGVVEEICVATGQTIAAGDKIAVIEAMKMKTPIHAHRAGTVTTIAVKPGDAVEAGRVLLTIA